MVSLNSEQTPNFAMDTSDVGPDADRALERFTVFCPGGPTKAVHAGDKC